MAVGFLQEEKKSKRRVKHHITDKMEDQGLTHQDMSEYLGYNSRQVFDYKLKNMTFNCYELKRIFSKVKFSDNEILELLKGE